MSPALHIKDSSDPIINNWRLDMFTFKIPRLRIANFILTRWRNGFIRSLDKLQLAMEGLTLRSREFTPEIALDALNQLKPIITDLQNRYEDIKDFKPLVSKEVKVSYKNALNSMYRLESKLHLIAYKDSPSSTIDSDLKVEMSENSRNFVQRVHGSY